MVVIRIKTLFLYVIIGIITFYAFNYSFVKPVVLADAEEKDGIVLPIIMYHSITDNPNKVSKYVISTKMFEDDLIFLKEKGYTTVTMDEVINYVKGDGELPLKPILLSFDDGYYNNYCYGYSLLKKYNMKAVISIIGRYTDLYTENQEKNPSYSHITWGEIEEMIKSGHVEIQNHSYDLHSNDKGRNGAKKKLGESKEAYAEFLKNDIGRLQVEIEKHTGYTPTTFTYPFGGISNDSCEILEDMGFEATLSCEEKVNYLIKDEDECLKMMNRFLRSNKVDAKSILSKY